MHLVILIGFLLANIENSFAKRDLLESIMLAILIFLIKILSCLYLSSFFVIARFIMKNLLYIKINTKIIANQ